MNILKKLFSVNAPKPSTTKPDQPLVWYFAKNTRKHVRQIVLTVPKKNSDSKPRIQGMLIAGSEYTHLLMNPTALIVMRMEDDLSPFICLRADSVIEQFQGCPMRLAFSFYQMDVGGLFMLLLHIDCPAVSKKMGVPLVFENAHTLDLPERLKLLTELMNRDVIELCFIAGNGPGTLPTGSFGMRFSLNEECRKQILQEFNNLLAYHKETIASHRSMLKEDRYDLCYQQWNSENPPHVNSVLGKG